MVIPHRAELEKELNKPEIIILIRKGDLEAVYNYLENSEECQLYIDEFTDLLSEANINPVEYIHTLKTNRIPSGYSNDFSKFTNIKEILDGTFRWFRIKEGGSLVLPDSVKKIGSEAFFKTGLLEDNMSLIISTKSLKEVGRDAFSMMYCTNNTGIGIIIDNQKFEFEKNPKYRFFAISDNVQKQIADYLKSRGISYSYTESSSI